MAERVAPPSWTEWARTPNERSANRQAFDELFGELRKEGMIDVRGSLFVHLVKFSYLQTSNAVLEVAQLIKSVPDSVYGTTPPNYRTKEMQAVLTILKAAGLLKVLETSKESMSKVQLTERQTAAQLASANALQAVLQHLRKALTDLEPSSAATQPSTFPTPDSVARAAKAGSERLQPGANCVAVQDRPETNETNPNPFLQKTIEAADAPLVLLQFWPLPNPKKEATPTADEPEFSLLFPGEITLDNLVRTKCLPILDEFFKGAGNQDEAATLQVRYATYMQRYREKFAANQAPPATDRLHKVLTTTDPDSEGFANAVYVVVQVIRKTANPVVYQAARIAWASCMAMRVAKRKEEKAALVRSQDTALLVSRLRESSGPVSLEDLKKTPDISKKSELGSKYPSLVELLPLSASKEGLRPLVFEFLDEFVHRDNLIRTFLDLRQQEAKAQQERLSQLWAREGIPEQIELFLLEKDVSKLFLRSLELLRQERLLALTTADFVRDYLPVDRGQTDIVRWLFPDGSKGLPAPAEVVTRGLDPVLYEDRDRLRLRSLVGVLGLTTLYPQIVKATWNLIVREEGYLSYLLRKLMAMFGGKPKPPKKAKEAKGSKVANEPKAAKGHSAEKSRAHAVPSQSAEDFKKLIELAPLSEDRATLIAEREKSLGQWNLKLDPSAAKQTQQSVDKEIAHYAKLLNVDMMAEENSAKVALFLIDKSAVLKGITTSRSYQRYLYLTALQRLTEALSK